MPEAVGSVEIQITGNTDQFEQALQRAKTAAANIGRVSLPTSLNDQFTAGAASADKLSESFKNVEKSAGPLSSALGGISEQVIELAKGYAALLTVEKAVDFIKESVRAFAEQEQQVRTLEQQLAKLGDRTSLTMEDLDKYREGLVATTQATNEQVRAAETAALRLGVTGDTMGKVLTTAQDLAAVNFGSLISNTDLLSRAIENPERVLSRLSLRFPELAGNLKGVVLGLRQMGDGAGAANLIMDQLTKSVGGAAAAANTGLSGGLNSVTKSLAEFQEAVGKFMADSGFGTVLQGLTNDFNALNRAVQFTDAYFDSLGRKWEKIKIILGGDWYKMGPQSPISASAAGKGDLDVTAKRFSDAFQQISVSADEMQKHLDAALEGVTDPAKRQSIIETTLAMFHWGDAIGATTKHLQELAQAEKDRQTQRDIDVQSAQLELSLIGQSTEKADAERKIFQDISALKQKLAQEGGISDKEIQAIRDADTEIAHLNQQLRETSTLLQLQQDQQLLFASDTENKVASALRSVYGDAWPKYTDSLIAQQVRLNENLQKTYDLTRSFAGTFVDDLMSGKSAIDSITDALNNLEKQIIQMALDASIKGLFGLLTAGASASSGNFFTNLVTGISTGGTSTTTGTPHAQTGGYIGSTPLHRKKPGEKLAYDEFPAILHVGERVIPRGGGEPKHNLSGEQMLRLFGGVPSFDDGWSGSYSTSATGVSTSGHDTSYWGGGGGIQSGSPFGSGGGGGGGFSFSSGSSSGSNSGFSFSSSSSSGRSGGAWGVTPSGSYSYQNATGIGPGGGYQGTYYNRAGQSFTYESGPPLTSGYNAPFGAGGVWGAPAPVISAPVRRTSGGGRVSAGGGGDTGGGADGGGGDGGGAAVTGGSEFDAAFAHPTNWQDLQLSGVDVTASPYPELVPVNPLPAGAGWRTYPATQPTTTQLSVEGAILAGGGWRSPTANWVSTPSKPVPTTTVYPNLWVSGDAQSIAGAGPAREVGGSGNVGFPLPFPTPRPSTVSPSYGGAFPWAAMTGAGFPWSTTASPTSGPNIFSTPAYSGSGAVLASAIPYSRLYENMRTGAGLSGYPPPSSIVSTPFNFGGGTMVGAGLTPYAVAPPAYGGAFPWNAGRLTGRQPYSGFITAATGGEIQPSYEGTVGLAHPINPIPGTSSFFDTPPIRPPFDTAIRVPGDNAIRSFGFGTATPSPFGFTSVPGVPVTTPIDPTTGRPYPPTPFSVPIPLQTGGTIGQGGWYGGQGTYYTPMAPYPLTRDFRPPGWTAPPFPYPEGSLGWWGQRIGAGLGAAGSAAGNAAGSVRDFFLGPSTPGTSGMLSPGGAAATLAGLFSTPASAAERGVPLPRLRPSDTQSLDNLMRGLAQQPNPLSVEGALAAGGGWRAPTGPIGDFNSVGGGGGYGYMPDSIRKQIEIEQEYMRNNPYVGTGRPALPVPFLNSPALLGQPPPTLWERFSRGITALHNTVSDAVLGTDYTQQRYPARMYDLTNPWTPMRNLGAVRRGADPNWIVLPSQAEILSSPSLRLQREQEARSFNIYHTGGVVGSTPVQQRILPARLLINAPRFQEGLQEGEYPAILHHGETVTPAGGRPSQPAPQIVVNTPPQPAPTVMVNIVNNANADVSTHSQDDNGNIKLDIIIDELVSGKMRDGGSKISKTLSSMGARAQPLRR